MLVPSRLGVAATVPSIPIAFLIVVAVITPLVAFPLWNGAATIKF